MEQTAIGAILTNIGTIFTQSLTWVSSVAETIVNTPLLMICVIGFLTVGFVVGLLTRLLRA